MLLKISNLDIEVVKTHYVAISLASFLLGFLIYAKYANEQKSSEETAAQKWTRRVSLLFPYHFSALGLAQITIKRMILARKLDQIIRKMTKKSEDWTMLSGQYLIIKQQMEKSYETIRQLKSTLLTMTLSEVLMEGIPQFITMTTIIINQLKTGYPKLQVLFENFSKTALGINGSYLCITVLFINLCGYASTLTETTWGKHYPMGAGIPGTFAIIVTHFLFLITKVVFLVGIAKHG